MCCCLIDCIWWRKPSITGIILLSFRSILLFFLFLLRNNINTVKFPFILEKGKLGEKHLGLTPLGFFSRCCSQKRNGHAGGLNYLLFIGRCGSLRHAKSLLVKEHSILLGSKHARKPQTSTAWVFIAMQELRWNSLFSSSDIPVVMSSQHNLVIMTLKRVDVRS